MDLKSVTMALCVIASAACGGRLGRDAADEVGEDASTDAGSDAGLTQDAGTNVCPTETKVVSTQQGCLRGHTDGLAISFKGIPFAQPPLGPLRFKAPASPLSWSGVRDAASFSLACPQINPLISGEVLPWSEDCLYLNVWTGSLKPAELRPVMVWIHGGGLQNGSASQALYNGQSLAVNHDVVVVSVNYRLGQLGYLAHAAFSAESEKGVSGNWGLLDQIQALKWVRDHAKAFGGDPSNVTIFGESAGAVSVCSLMTTPLAQGLFHRAIVESASCAQLGSYAQPLRGGTESAEAQGTRVANALGCFGSDVAACMRAKTATEVLQALPAKQGLFDSGERYAFAIDGWVLAEAPRALVAKGQINKVPVMIGTTGDENTIFSSVLQINTATKYAFLLSQYFGSNASAVEKRFPASSFDSPKAAFDAVMTAAIFTCPTRSAARDLVRSQVPVFRYQFTWVTELAKLTKLGAFHSSEIEFVFGTLSARKMFPASQDEQALSTAMSGYWSQFARQGDPGGDWKAFVSGNERYLEFRLPVAAKAGLKDDDCDFFDGLN